MVENERLYEGSAIDSANGEYRLVYQGDGHLVLYRLWDWLPLWWSGTAGSSVGFVVMQDDGNFVLYDASDSALYASGTHQHPGAWLVLHNNGALIIYDANGSVLHVIYAGQAVTHEVLSPPLRSAWRNDRR
jgi:hypothetical protein